MQLLPIQTRVLQPPHDDLLMALLEQQPEVEDGDVFLLSAKVVALDEGCCCSVDTTDKQGLMTQLADITIPRPYWGSPLMVKNHTFLGSAGVDESNGNGYYVGLPTDCMASARRLHGVLQTSLGLRHCGVVIVDSRSQPFRYGATGVALGWWGIAPLQDHRGRKDLFGRTVKVERSNVVDGLAAAATVVMGEVDERVPAVIARDVPGLAFTDHTTAEDLFVRYEEDTFRVLYEKWLPR